MIESKWAQRLFGLFLLALGIGFTAWTWHTALTEGYYYRNAAALFPAFAVLGLGMLFFPIDVEELRARHGVDKPQKLSHYPPAWKVLFVVALAAALGNWFAIAHSEPVAQTDSPQGQDEPAPEKQPEPADETPRRPPQAESRGLGGELWGWFKIVLVLGGVVVAMVGLIWSKTVDLVRRFGKEVQSDNGIWVMLGGAAMLGTGLALFYFNL